LFRWPYRKRKVASDLSTQIGTFTQFDKQFELHGPITIVNENRHEQESFTTGRFFNSTNYLPTSAFTSLLRLQQEADETRTVAASSEADDHSEVTIINDASEEEQAPLAKRHRRRRRNWNSSQYTNVEPRLFWFNQPQTRKFHHHVVLEPNPQLTFEPQEQQQQQQQLQTIVAAESSNPSSTATSPQTPPTATPIMDIPTAVRLPASTPAQHESNMLSDDWSYYYNNDSILPYGNQQVAMPMMGNEENIKLPSFATLMQFINTE